MSPSTILDIARGLVDLLLKIVPAPVAQKLITEADVRRANAIGELADDVKFGPEKP
jgi:hypothetical protein